jgi:hypothetical protein
MLATHAAKLIEEIQASGLDDTRFHSRTEDSLIAVRFAETALVFQATQTSEGVFDVDCLEYVSMNVNGYPIATTEPRRAAQVSFGDVVAGFRHWLRGIERSLVDRVALEHGQQPT